MTEITLEQIETARQLMSYGDPNVIKSECHLSYSRTYGIAYGLYRGLPIRLIQLRLRKVNDELGPLEVEILLDNYWRLV